MNLMDLVLNSQNSGAISEVAKNFGLGQNQTQGVLKQLLPMLARGLQNNASKPGGLESIIGALSTGGHDQYLNNPEVLGQSTTAADGNAILGHIFGNKDVSRNVAANAAAKTGLSSSLIKKMLPVVATIAMGALTKGAGSKGILGQASASNSSSAGGILNSLLDSDNDGSILDDVLSLATRLF